ncbi:DUF5924 family protein [Thauera linaloolentis]|uniref:DUF2914 domain-containing protein n=1 Tax=Thauera linaloolentis (strain DSM 12138 / JCM 21573 / CCUG 41526 / CIP 105981 / IAM 15112 / NBRC 102519 / 47Lol) TaxID=1123367 RepID=N6Y377_THAL4|nr:DUF5924 family protein [Thauera linaloolentis]ENO88661.1 hypothetical protein C666_08360 [Thauera linaloolentis 47Lol = DSM 12138]MCM8565706.1 DUF2914 domain-containing protein [Thauera linaloolentis]
MPDLKLSLLHLVALAQRYPGVIAGFGFVSGVASFFLVERHEGFARIIAVAMLLGWVWLVLERVLSEMLHERFGLRLPPPLLRYATQMIHQESLFFALPFFLASTSWNSGQAVFTSGLIAAALVALIDPIYYRRLAPRRWLFLTYHTVTLFAVLLVAMPLILQVPTARSYELALGIAVLLAFPSLLGSITVPRWWRGVLVVGLMLALAAAGWLARLWVPPATLRLADMALAIEVDDANRAPAGSLVEIDAARLAAQGLYAYTAIRAPLGLQERIQHVWLHEGREIDRIALDIRGGREEGYRAWTRKQNFPPDPAGRWQVRVLTGDEQMIGTLRFRVRGEEAGG